MFISADKVLVPWINWVWSWSRSVIDDSERILSKYSWVWKSLLLMSRFGGWCRVGDIGRVRVDMVGDGLEEAVGDVVML